MTYSLITLIAAVLLAYPAVARDDGDRPVRWKRSDGGNGHLYQAVLVPGRINWVEAQLAAAARGCGWHLATITSEAEDDFVFSLISGREEFFAIGGHGPWLGGFQRNSTDEPDGEWRWVTEEGFEFTNCVDGQPNNSFECSPDTPELAPGVPCPTSEDFAHYTGDLGDNWNDLTGNALLNGYMVERESCRRGR